MDVAYIVGLEARGLSPHARRVMESGTVEVCEWTNYALAVRFQAAAMGVPFLPARTMLGTDTFRRSAARVIDCPFTGRPLVAVPALYPDVAAIHVHEADRYGNCRIRGTTVADLDLARAAKRVIITCERLIPHDEFRRDPHLTAIPFFCVDAVCEVPYGSYPGNMPVRVLLRRGPPAGLADRREGPGYVSAVPGGTHFRGPGLRRLPGRSAAGCRGCRSCGRKSFCWHRPRNETAVRWWFTIMRNTFPGGVCL